MSKHVLLLALLGAVASGCSEVPDYGESTEVISRVELTFTPVGGGASMTFAFSDPDGDGGSSGMSDPITLAAATEYTLEIAFINEFVAPPEDITEQIREEAEDHFVFVVGDAISGPASTSSSAFVTHAYADLESDYTTNTKGEDLPVGLANTVTTDAAGTGTLRIVLRHLPDLNGAPQKSGDLPQALANGDDLPGDVDADVSFELTVQ
jgi:hypothetical protein